MSYILDALRKSEQQRLGAGPPGLNSPRVAAPEAAAAHRRWKLLAVLLLAINAGAVGWWLAPARPDLPPATRASLPQAPIGAVPAATPAAAAPVSAAAGPAEGARPVPPSPPAAGVARDAPVAQSDPAAASAPSAPPTISAVRPEPPSTPRAALAAPQQTAPDPQVPVRAAPSPPKGIVAFADLPETIRQALPPLHINGYAEGAGGEAMLLVNDRLVSAGDELGAGLRVLEISRDGSVFSFRSYRFRR
jgi:general secretion pathway protein B